MTDSTTISASNAERDALQPAAVTTAASAVEPAAAALPANGDSPGQPSFAGESSSQGEPDDEANSAAEDGSSPAMLRDFERIFDHFRGVAEAVPLGRVQPLRADLNLALHNAQQAVTWVDSHREQIVALPGMDPNSLLELPALVGAALVADRRIERFTSKHVRPVIEEGRALRGALLASADALVAAGILPEEKVKPIHKGRGVMNSATDCVELAMLFRQSPELLASTPLTPEQVDRCAEVGTALLQLLTPERGKRVTVRARREAILLRDRFWTLAVERAAALLRCAVFLFGAEEAELRAPSLMAHRSRRHLTNPSAALVDATDETPASEPQTPALATRGADCEQQEPSSPV